LLFAKLILANVHDTLPLKNNLQQINIQMFCENLIWEQTFVYEIVTVPASHPFNIYNFVNHIFFIKVAL